MSVATRRREPLFWTGLAVAAIVFAIDLRTRLGYAAAVPYVFAVWLAYASGGRGAVWGTAGLCSVLTIVGALSSPAGGEVWEVAANRCLAFVAIWVTALCCLRILEVLESIDERAEQAERSAVDAEERRREDRRRRRAMANVLEDLELERTRLREAMIDRERLERRFRVAVESAPTAMVMIDDTGRIVLVNSETEVMFGYERERLLDEPVETLVPERFRTDHQSHRESFLAHPEARRMGVGRDLFGLRADGTEFPIEIGLSPVVTDEGVFVLSAIADISQRKELEQAQRALNEELERRVAARTAELARTNEALERSNQELRQFAYVASHDLQTPLRGIAGYAQFLVEDYADDLDDMARQYIGKIVDGSKRMKQLINDLLSYSRVQTRGAPFEPTDLNVVVDDALVLLEAAITESGAEVTRGDLPTINADAAQLSQLLSNLIENGLKYRTEETPRVHVGAARDDDATLWRITVRDNGIGIAPEHHDRIFEIFRRLHTQDEYPGTGIGLAVCGRIVQRHGGRIWVDSEVGGGSTFTFELPDRDADAEDAAA